MGAIVIQTLITVIISVLVFLNAFATVWPSYALKTLEAEDSPLGYRITRSDGNLIGSAVMLGSVISILAAGYINDKIGRKRSVILTGLSLALAWSIKATSKSLAQLLIGRLILGLSGGLQVVTVVIFVSEISTTSMRGPLLTLSCSFYNIGALASYLAGWFCSYKVINYLNLTVVVALIVIVSFLKETPPFLLKMGKEKEALASLKFYRGTSDVDKEILDELSYMRTQLQYNDIDEADIPDKIVLSEKEKLNQEQNVHEKQQENANSSWKMLLSSKPSQRIIILMCVQIILAVNVGLIGIQAYAGPMFQRAVPTLSPDLCSVIVAIVLSISGIVAVFVTDTVRRRLLSISTCMAASACMALLASLLRWSWAPVWAIPLVILFYCGFFQIGVINVPFVQAAECLPPQLKSLGASITMFCMFMSNFLILLLFQPAINVLGLDGVFLLFSVIGLLTAAVSYFFMRETKHVPFEDMYETFKEGYLYRAHKTI